MIPRYQKTVFICFLLGLFCISGCQQPQPQEPDPVRRKSPIAIAKISHQPSDTYIKVVYGQPYKRDRRIFGGLVPYNKVWRTGANEATELTTTKDIIFGGRKLSAGTYALFTIPKDGDSWTIILNDQLGQWGAFEYDSDDDVMRIEAPSRKKEGVTEAFTIEFSDIMNDSTNIILQWDQTVVKVPVEFDQSPTENS